MEDHTFNWKGYEWITRERWGELHPEKPWALYSKDSVNVDKNGNIVLSIDKPTTYNGKTVYPMGLMSTTENNSVFSYGFYSFVAKLPRGKNLWSALWMWSWDTWPPELDVMEAWSNKCGGYLMNDRRYLHVTNCYHFDEKDGHEFGYLKLKNCWYCLPQYSFNEYSMDWEPDYIRFYFNGKMIREIKEKERLQWISDNTKSGMNVIMNLYPTKDYKEGDMKTPLIVKDFRYTPSK